MTFEMVSEKSVRPLANLKVVGVGGAGGNAVDHMIRCQVKGVEFIAVNTDGQALSNSQAPVKIQIGTQLTHGLGAGGQPEVGRQAAQEDRNQMLEILQGADMVFITAGQGGGTGTGASPVIAEIAKELDALTVAVVSLPFSFEGPPRCRRAQEGLRALKEAADAIIVLPNDKLVDIVDKDTTFLKSFAVSDDVLRRGVQGLTDLIALPGLMNLDFGDVRSVMASKGAAIMGMGVAKGEGKAIQAAREAITSPLLSDYYLQGAKGIIINVSGDNDMTLREVKEAVTTITSIADPEADIFVGAVVDESFADEMRVTVIATGFNEAASIGPTRRSAPDGQLDLDTPTFLRQPSPPGRPPNSSGGSGLWPPKPKNGQ